VRITVNNVREGAREFYDVLAQIARQNFSHMNADNAEAADGKGDLCHEDISVVVACLDDGLDDVTRSFYRENEGRY
jgi:hypothetical protein